MKPTRHLNRFAIVPLLAAALYAYAGGPKPTMLQGGDVAPKVADLKQVLPVPASGYVVNGVTRFDGWFLKADRLIFKKGATLMFTRQALASRRVFFIVAKSIEVEDPSAPGRITWEENPTAGAGATAGQAGTGAVNGGAGQPGAPGNDGPAGESTPSIQIAVLKFTGSGPSLDLQGQPGGTGGQGQKGGSGGPGSAGESASQSAFDCRRGAGNGGKGGPGGPGGVGGAPGRGGNGGTVTILSTADMMSTISTRVRVLVSGGVAGQPGAGGPGGDGGPGGPGGAQQLPWCRGDGSQGAVGDHGRDGPPGTADAGTRRGADGDFLLGAITADAFFGSIYGDH